MVKGFFNFAKVNRFGCAFLFFTVLLLNGCSTPVGTREVGLGEYRPYKGFRWANPGKSGDFSIKPAKDYRWLRPDDSDNYSVVSQDGEIISAYTGKVIGQVAPETTSASPVTPPSPATPQNTSPPEETPKTLNTAPAHSATVEEL